MHVCIMYSTFNLLSLEKKTPGRTHGVLSILKRGLKEDGERLFLRVCSDRTRGTSFKGEKVRFRLEKHIYIYLLFFFFNEGGETLRQMV